MDVPFKIYFKMVTNLVRNRAKLKVSIADACVLEEILTCVARYLEVRTYVALKFKVQEHELSMS